MKYLVIGDIHGRPNWKEFVKKHSDDVDKIIFLGDYVDHWTYSNDEITLNLIDILNFKKDNHDKCVLLLGNHDLQYYYSYSSHGCSGFRGEKYYDWHEIFNKNANLFQVAYQDKKWIFSHAGISNYWYGEFKQSLISKNLDTRGLNIAGKLNLAFQHNIYSIFAVGYARGGFKGCGGIFWADSSETNDDMLNNYHQVVGHTHIDKITTIQKNKKTSITYIDCENDCFILNI